MERAGTAGEIRAHRILYVITDLEVGGVPLHLLRLASGMKSRGWYVEVASLKPPGPVANRLQDAGIAVRSCEVRSQLDWRVFERLARLIHDADPEIVHSLLFHANNAARVASVLAGFPLRRLMCEIQTVEIERRWHLAIDRFTHRLGRFTVANSPSVLAHLRDRAGMRAERLRLVTGGIDVGAMERAPAPDREALGVREGEALLLWAGRLDPVKGLDTLLGAANELRSDTPFKLLLAGEGAYRAVVEERIAGNGLADVVHLLGRRDDVPSLLRAADAFVFPSLTEGMPNVLLEAMAAGVPIVATNVPGNRDLVTHGETGLLVPAGDGSALCAAIRRILHDTALAARLSATSRHYVTDRFSLDACIDRYERLYGEVLG